MTERRRFNLPFAIFAEPMPASTFKLLAFLFSISDFGGACRPGYALMRSGTGISSTATINGAIDYLRETGWIKFVKPGGKKFDTIGLAIPSRLREKDVPMAVFRRSAAVSPALLSFKK